MLTNTPIFSILVPVYNQINYIRECLDAILCQTFTDFEVIITDDGSNDGSEAVCDEYAEKFPDKVRVFHQKNAGLIMARKNGLDRAGGRYVLFWDSDDYVKTDALLRIYEASLDQKVDIIMFNAFSDGKEKLFDVDFDTDEKGCLKDLQQLYDATAGGNCYNAIWPRCYRRSLIDTELVYRQAEEISMGEDVYQILPIIDGAKTVSYIPDALYYYRINASSMTHKWKAGYYDSMKLVMARRLEYGKKWKVPEDRLNLAMGDNAHMCMNSLIRSDLPKKEKKNLIRQMASDDTYRTYHRYYYPYVSGKLQFLLNLTDAAPGLGAALMTQLF